MVTAQDDGALLQQALDFHKSFISHGYSVLRHLNEQLSQRAFRIVQGGGVARNGFGTGFQSPTEWVQSYMGVAFVDESAPRKDTQFQTAISGEGTRSLLFQIRWLERAPVIQSSGPSKCWLLTRPERAVTFEAYYASLFSGLTRDEGRPGQIKSFDPAPNKYKPIHCSGSYREVPIVALENEASIRELVVEPAMEFWSTAL